MYFIATELREIMAQLGFRTVNEMVGQSQKLTVCSSVSYEKSKKLDFSAILYKSESTKPRYHTQNQDHRLENVLDFSILTKAHPAIYRKEKMSLAFPICNTDRSVGAILSNELSKIYGEAGLPKDTLKVRFKGTAGQTFGGFLTKGVTFYLEGNANDYLGKGLSGGKLIIQTPKEATFTPEENIIVGNVALYGAISGEVYINGVAGERFCVRNSGATAVVEGVGDHGCEYMTGGIAVILGKVGKNFAAGMSGGIAYVLDKKGQFKELLCNRELVEIESISQKDDHILQRLVNKHHQYTNSRLAYRILHQWENHRPLFVKVIPTEYKKALERLEQDKKKEKKVVYSI